MIAYDDLGAGKRAKELCDRITQSLGPGFRLDLSVWKASLFGLSEMRLAATGTAARAMAIIVVLAGGKELAPELKAWLQGFTPSRQCHRSCALAVLLYDLPRSGVETAAAYVSLKRYARNARMAFFADIIDPKEDEEDYSVEGIHQRAFSSTCVLDAILQHH